MTTEANRVAHTFVATLSVLIGNLWVGLAVGDDRLPIPSISSNC